MRRSDFLWRRDVRGVLAVPSPAMRSRQDDPIAERQALMKENGAQATVAGQMIQGATPFDAAAAKAAMKKLAANAAEIPADSSRRAAKAARRCRRSGQNFADFEANAAALKTAAEAAAAAAAARPRGLRPGIRRGRPVPAAAATRPTAKPS